MIIRGITELIHGYVEGDVTAGAVRIHKTGKCYGDMNSESAEVLGTLQGNVTVRNLINIHELRFGQRQRSLRQARPRVGWQPERRGLQPPSIGGDLD